jgi:hypothetical protein
MDAARVAGKKTDAWLIVMMMTASGTNLITMTG